MVVGRVNEGGCRRVVDRFTVNGFNLKVPNPSDFSGVNWILYLGTTGTFAIPQRRHTLFFGG